MGALNKEKSEKFYVVNGSAKLKLNGDIKHIPNNNSNTRWVDPIRDREDIVNVKEYLQAKIDYAPDDRRKKIAARNKLLFIIGINVGLRVSDLQTLTWGQFFDKDGKFVVNAQNKTEKKTGKMKSIIINESIRNAITEYLQVTEVNPILDRFVFVSNKTDKNGHNTHITEAGVKDMIKDFAVNCKLEGNYNTHSLRKTYAYHIYMTLVEKNDQLALPKVQKLLNHRNQNDTLRYLGLQQKMEKDIIEELNL